MNQVIKCGKCVFAKMKLMKMSLERDESKIEKKTTCDVATSAGMSEDWVEVLRKLIKVRQ